MKVTSISSIDPKAVAANESNCLLLDVRAPFEYRSGHIEGAVSHPLDKLSPAEVEKLVEGKQHCVVICAAGARARRAADKLLMSELPDLQVMEGGMQAWEAAGLPVRRLSKTLPLMRQVQLVAGLFILLGVSLGYLVNPAWLLLALMVGFGMTLVGLTGFCPMAMLLAKMPWNRVSGPVTSCSLS